MRETWATRRCASPLKWPTRQESSPDGLFGAKLMALASLRSASHFEEVSMQRKIRLLSVVFLAVFLLAPNVYSVVTPIAKITLNQTQFEKFGSLFFPFVFVKPQVYVLCQIGVDPTGQRCVSDDVSDVISVTNNDFNEGVVAMISEVNGQHLNLPPDFPLPPAGSPITFFKETGKVQRLTGTAGLPTVNPDGTLGPVIRLSAVSDLEQLTTTSDVLMVSSQ
jgi:hypothetical protein